MRKEGPPKEACRSHSFAAIRVRRVATPKQARADPASLLLPYKNIPPSAVSKCVDAWSQLKRSPSVGKQWCWAAWPFAWWIPLELSGPRLAHGDTTHGSNICKNFRDGCVLNTPTLSLLGLFKIKQAVIKVPRVMMMKWLLQSFSRLQNCKTKHSVILSHQKAGFTSNLC